MAMSRYSEDTILLARENLIIEIKKLEIMGMTNGVKINKLKKGVDAYDRFLRGELRDYELIQLTANIR